jgi:hypothetical protein
MLLRAAKAAIGEYLVEARGSWKAVSDLLSRGKSPARSYRGAGVDARSLEFTVSYIIDYRKRTAMKDQLFTAIIEEVTNSEGHLQWAAAAAGPANQVSTQAAIEAQPLLAARASARAADSAR